ncbi:Carbon storage regulator [bioreactor metagenome]|uniref:Carbon storage regulator n=1 Tax=bioreactor metagenome TaxID=1076179 RepID=A0A645DVG3_9ZZZZ
MLVISRKSGQTFHIGDHIHITITEISGDKVKIGIDAPLELNVLRDELLQTIKSNVAAVHKADNSAVHSLAASLKQISQQNKKPPNGL